MSGYPRDHIGDDRVRGTLALSAFGQGRCRGLGTRAGSETSKKCCIHHHHSVSIRDIYARKNAMLGSDAQNPLCTNKGRASAIVRIIPIPNPIPNPIPSTQHTCRNIAITAPQTEPSCTQRVSNLALPFHNKEQCSASLPLGPLLVQHARTALLAANRRALLQRHAHGAVAAHVVHDAAALARVVARRGGVEGARAGVLGAGRRDLVLLARHCGCVVLLRLWFLFAGEEGR